jgi:dihydroorotate dehydrogenase
MYKLIRPLLFKIDSETIHNKMLALGGFLHSMGLDKALSPLYNFHHQSLEQKVFDLDFINPVGLAAGFDKQGKIIDFLPNLGFGFLQIGDVSNLPWPGNPKPRLFRLTADQALINRLGQNNKGAQFLAGKITARKSKITLGVSVVKTPNPNILEAAAVQDFVSSFKILYPLSDFSVINVSCPNTAEGKTFEDSSALNDLLIEINKAKLESKINKPILVKISPDLSFEELEKVLEVCESYKIDGYILTNTTKSRQGLKTSADIIENIGKGGLSGQPLRQKSTEIIRHAYKILKRPCIIGLGGINSAESAYEKIKAGASLIQIYTGLIYEGPGLVKKINKGLVELLKRDGFKNIAEAVGTDIGY